MESISIIFRFFIRNCNRRHKLLPEKTYIIMFQLCMYAEIALNIQQSTLGCHDYYIGNRDQHVCYCINNGPEMQISFHVIVNTFSVQ